MSARRCNVSFARRAVAVAAAAACAWCASPAFAAPDVKRVARGDSPPRSAAQRGRDASSCQGLFGLARERARRRTRRQQLLHVVQGRGKRYVIAHGSNRWSYPRRIEFRGLQITGLDVARQAVRVKLSPELASKAGCEAGSYRVGIDDTIGAGSVLAVLAHGVLLERDERLRYLGSDEAPTFWMVWGSRYRVVLNQARGVSSSSRRRAKRRRRRVRKRRKRRARKRRARKRRRRR